MLMAHVRIPVAWMVLEMGFDAWSWDVFCLTRYNTSNRGSKKWGGYRYCQCFDFQP